MLNVMMGGDIEENLVTLNSNLFRYIMTIFSAVLGLLLLKRNHTTYYILLNNIIYVIRYSYMLLSMKCN